MLEKWACPMQVNVNVTWYGHGDWLTAWSCFVVKFSNGALAKPIIWDVVQVLVRSHGARKEKATVAVRWVMWKLGREIMEQQTHTTSGQTTVICLLINLQSTCTPTAAENKLIGNWHGFWNIFLFLVLNWLEHVYLYDGHSLIRWC